ncbi:MAG: RNA polymerase factor sigma-54 [Gemmatimonadaceae bacterium]|nr:RNA polymerase factor sigma-54 [Gemmatimonadaceae bacterium]
MRMEHALSQRLEQKLRLAPQILQSIEILQLATLDLKGLIEREMEMNPTIEIDTQDPLSTPGEGGVAVDIVTPGDAAPDAPISAEAETASLDAEFERLEGLNEQWKEFSGSYRPTMGGEDKDKKLEAMQNTADRSESLQDVLDRQLSMLNLKERDQKIAGYLIWNIDENGYLRFQLDEEFMKGCEVQPPSSLEEAEDALELIQSFEPPGVGARDLRECLLLQLRELPGELELPRRILTDHFDELIAHRWVEIARRTGTTAAEVQHAADQIAKLNPKPGYAKSAGPDSYVIPDLVVEKVDGQYLVFLNDTNIPRLRLSRVYQEMARDRKKFTPEHKEFIASKLNAAQWLIQAIEQRRHTMLKVMHFIVDRQREYFEKGIQHLRPLTLREVADVIGMHESTVSRVTSDKYVQTPRGVLPLKFFFSSGIATADGEDMSARGIKDKIEKLVKDEDPKDPLTDQAIVEILEREGIRIARRTVAKYRDQLHVLPARMRKRV